VSFAGATGIGPRLRLFTGSGVVYWQGRLPRHGRSREIDDQTGAPDMGAGFTPAEAANRLKIDEARLAAWEDPADEDAPSIPQLRKIAAFFKRPLAVFYLEEAPPRFAVMRHLRRLPGVGARSYSPAVQLEIRAANERRELALDLAADAGDVARFPHPLFDYHFLALEHWGNAIHHI